MIVKERSESEHREDDDFARSGARTEEQMAHYLRRAFADDPEVFVLHDLRLEVEDDTKEVLQIDHLVLHRHGFILIESKSVTGRVLVNEHGEWVRTWSGGAKGMQSPVLQAQRQADLLRKALVANNRDLLAAFLFGKLQKGFDNCPMEIVVAISDQGIIERHASIDELCKADQVPSRVTAIINRHRKAATILGTVTTAWSRTTDGMMNLSAEEQQKIVNFLVAHHYPLQQAGSRRSDTHIAKACNAQVPPPLSEHRCPRCGSSLVQRTARKGAHAGDQFWGCSAFPKCRYMSSTAAP